MTGPAVEPLAHVQVVRGAPDEVELAALVAGLVAAAGQRDSSEAGDGHPGDQRTGRGTWSDPARRLGHAGAGTGGTWRTGADTWRWSLRG